MDEPKITINAKNALDSSEIKVQVANSNRYLHGSSERVASLTLSDYSNPSSIKDGDSDDDDADTSIFDEIEIVGDPTGDEPPPIINFAFRENYLDTMNSDPAPPVIRRTETITIEKPKADQTKKPSDIPLASIKDIDLSNPNVAAEAQNIITLRRNSVSSRVHSTNPSPPRSAQSVTPSPPEASTTPDKDKSPPHHSSSPALASSFVNSKYDLHSHFTISLFHSALLYP